LNTPTSALRSHALALDDADSLKAIRHEFLRPRRADGSDVAYLCGHSLGLEPRRAVTYVNEELEEWQRLAVEGHFNGRRPWLSYHERLTPPLARLAGALPLEVVAMNSLTVNLHLLLVSFYRPAGNRRKLLIERPAFPSDRYAAVSQILAHGLDPADALLEIGPREGEDRIREEDVMSLLDREGESIATVLLASASTCRQSHALRKPKAVSSALTSLMRSATCRCPCTTGTSILRCGAATSI
jgi:kynureninase